MKLFINDRQKAVLIEALRVYQEEQFSIAKSVASGYLRAGFERDAEATGDLITKVQNVKEEYDALDRGIQEILARPQGPNTSNLIHAIKYCREQTGWYLKDSKDYVEKIRDAR
jgi:ribosomal protein L7/L12